jgi:hypothetical protein
MNFFGTFIGVVCGKWTKRQFIPIFQKLFLWLAKPQCNSNYANGYVNDMSMVMSAITPIITPYVATPATTPMMMPTIISFATPMTMPTTTPINNFYSSLYTLKGVIVTWRALMIPKKWAPPIRQVPLIRKVPSTEQAQLSLERIDLVFLV